MDNNLPVDLLHWSLAILPLVLLLLMLVVFKWSGGRSGWIAMAIATLIGFFMYEAPLDNLAVGFGKGLWEAFFILLVVWFALLLYHATDESGSFKVIREKIQDHSQNYLFIVLGFGWVFASFLQGVAGFGVPIAVVAPLLLGIGVKPVAAIIIPLIGHAWANMFGTLGVGWIATVNTVQIDNEALTLILTGILLWIPNIIGGLMICWLFARWKGIKEGFLAVIIISLIHGGGQLAIVAFNPELSTFIPAILAVGALFLLSKRKQYSEKSELEDETDILYDTDSKEEGKPDISLHKAFMPYYVLTGLSVVFLGIQPIQNFLDQFQFGFSFPAVETGYGFEMEAEDPYSPIAPLTHPGFYLLVSFIFAYFWYKYLGLSHKNTAKNIFSGMKENALGASLAITGFLTMTMIMENSGQTNVLALGIADVSPPAVYVALANVMGIIGAFMTSSNTSSNVLFAPLHGSVVNSMESLSMSLVIAAQSTGGAIGNVISPASIVLGTSTTNILGRESEVYKVTLTFVLIAGVLVSGVAVLMHYII
ncbi:lactate permease [Virgibacillus natechei]|uniref:L-lactate permease n=1 Tax=Virgibacillus natechei TaxID=1216297 RepID=A0ABS4IH62_9BACI|nr:L-lactate permease [Virgibacillus natechei]MBP1970208.1 lactate permease [Virgibacillus natechei]UZD12841.1 L-lactate permease [Virgibacillus natechei]